jgi:hypothetical protein
LDSFGHAARSPKSALASIQPSKGTSVAHSFAWLYCMQPTEQTVERGPRKEALAEPALLYCSQHAGGVCQACHVLDSTSGEIGGTVPRFHRHSFCSSRDATAVRIRFVFFTASQRNVSGPSHPDGSHPKITQTGP